MPKEAAEAEGAEAMLEREEGEGEEEAEVEEEADATAITRRKPCSVAEPGSGLCVLRFAGDTEKACWLQIARVGG